jgi:UTP:GlnB (protein PII) uridylyltransferase
MSIDKIQQAIMELSPEELTRFREWFEKYYAEVWDRQIETDAKSGRLDRFITDVDEEKALIEERRNEPERPLREYLKEKKS